MILFDYLADDIEMSIFWYSELTSIKPSNPVKNSNSSLGIDSLLYEKPLWWFWYEEQIQYATDHTKSKKEIIQKICIWLIELEEERLVHE